MKCYSCETNFDQSNPPILIRSDSLYHKPDYLVDHLTEHVVVVLNFVTFAEQELRIQLMKEVGEHMGSKDRPFSFAKIVIRTDSFRRFVRTAMTYYLGSHKDPMSQFEIDITSMTSMERHQFIKKLDGTLDDKGIASLADVNVKSLVRMFNTDSDELLGILIGKPLGSALKRYISSNKNAHQSKSSSEDEVGDVGTDGTSKDTVEGDNEKDDVDFVLPQLSFDHNQVQHTLPTRMPPTVVNRLVEPRFYWPTDVVGYFLSSLSLLHHDREDIYVHPKPLNLEIDIDILLNNSSVVDYWLRDFVVAVIIGENRSEQLHFGVLLIWRTKSLFRKIRLLDPYNGFHKDAVKTLLETIKTALFPNRNISMNGKGKEKVGMKHEHVHTTRSDWDDGSSCAAMCCEAIIRELQNAENIGIQIPHIPKPDSKAESGLSIYRATFVFCYMLEQALKLDIVGKHWNKPAHVCATLVE